jgi:hypothetical protein
VNVCRGGGGGTWLDVPVEDLLGVALGQRAQHGAHVAGHGALAVVAVTCRPAREQPTCLGSCRKQDGTRFSRPPTAPSAPSHHTTHGPHPTSHKVASTPTVGYLPMRWCSSPPLHHSMMRCTWVSSSYTSSSVATLREPRRRRRTLTSRLMADACCRRFLGTRLWEGELTSVLGKVGV